MKTIYVFLLTLVVLAATSPVSFAVSGVKSKFANGIIAFDKGFSPKQKTAVLEIANAIRSGNVERIGKYTKIGEDSNAIKVFWSGVDELSSLKFRARVWGKGFILSDANRGMSTCDVTKEEGHFVISGCLFNDGN